MKQRNMNALIPLDDIRAVNRQRSSWRMYPRATLSLEVPARKRLKEWGDTTSAVARHVEYQIWIADRLNYALSLLSDSVEVDPDVRSGVPVIRGTRVPLSRILAEIADGSTIVEVAVDLELDETVIRGFVECLSMVMDRPFT